MLFLLFSHKFSLFLKSDIISLYITGLQRVLPAGFSVVFGTEPLNRDIAAPVSLESPSNMSQNFTASEVNQHIFNRNENYSQI